MHSHSSRANGSRYVGTSILAATAVALLTPTALAERSRGVLEQAKLLGEAEAAPTSEQRMLQVARQEKEERRKASPDDALPKRVWRRVAIFCSDWIYEPIATAFRFTHLVAIFVPVLAAIPFIFAWERIQLWWYVFLINSMERAGPTFIKVYFYFPLRIRG